MTTRTVFPFNLVRSKTFWTSKSLWFLQELKFSAPELIPSVYETTKVLIWEFVLANYFKTHVMHWWIVNFFRACAWQGHFYDSKNNWTYFVITVWYVTISISDLLKKTYLIYYQWNLFRWFPSNMELFYKSSLQFILAGYQVVSSDEIQYNFSMLTGVYIEMFALYISKDTQKSVRIFLMRWCFSSRYSFFQLKSRQLP